MVGGLRRTRISFERYVRNKIKKRKEKERKGKEKLPKKKKKKKKRERGSDVISVDTI